MNNRLDRFRNSTSSLMSGSNALNAAKQRAILTLLPDTCLIFHKFPDSATVNRQGVPENQAWGEVRYNDSLDIPCRADLVRAFRPETMDYQPTVADEIDLHLPHDLELFVDDVVYLNNNRYQIRKLDDASVWDITKVAKIMRVTARLDPPL
jgi:hypothetical protein